MRTARYCSDNNTECSLKTRQTQKTIIVWCTNCDYNTTTRINSDGTLTEL